MTVKELRECLSQYPDDLMVRVDGYEDGYDDIADIQIVLLKLNRPSTEYGGKYQGASGGRADDPAIRALILGREWGGEEG